MKKVIEAFTDGGCSLKHKIGGWAFMITLLDGTEVTQNGFMSSVTNNQMELFSVLECLNWIRNKFTDNDVKVVLTSDSEYIVKGATQWLKKWKAKNWKTTTGLVKNLPLWQCLDNLIQDIDIEFKWVRGHTGNRCNTIVDKLAVKAYTDEIKRRGNDDIKH